MRQNRVFRGAGRKDPDATSGAAQVVEETSTVESVTDDDFRRILDVGVYDDIPAALQFWRNPVLVPTSLAMRAETEGSVGSSTPLFIRKPKLLRGLGIAVGAGVVHQLAVAKITFNVLLRATIIRTTGPVTNSTGSGTYDFIGGPVMLEPGLYYTVLIVDPAEQRATGVPLDSGDFLRPSSASILSNPTQHSVGLVGVSPGTTVSGTYSTRQAGYCPAIDLRFES